MNSSIGRWMIVFCFAIVFVSTTSAQIVSDDFNAYNLKQSIWTFTDPVGDATLSLRGTKTSNAWLSIAVPGDSAHDLWTDGNNVPRIMQAAPDSDCEIEVKFASGVSAAYQIEGVVAEEDATHLIRFEFDGDGTNTNVFVASFTGGFSSPVIQLGPLNIASVNVAPLWMRINRSGNTWTVSYSLNGSTFSPAGTFDLPFTLHKIGVFAGNDGTPVPAFTALVDYFFNTAHPISPEDGATSVVDSLPPLVYNVQPSAAATRMTINWKTDERAKGTVQYGTTLGYGSQVSHTDLRTVHALSVTGLTANTVYNYRIISQDSVGNKDTTGNYTVITGPLPQIAIWYGSTQTFGKMGTAQRGPNILGNAASPYGIDSLSYRLNGGAPVKLSWGPDARLLSQPGDFNVDLGYATLAAGSNTVVITVKDKTGETATSTVTVKDSTGRVWPLPYTVGWGSATSLQDSAQVVDGKWGIVAGGIKPIVRGYDREIAIGDTTWTDYEVTAQFTVQGIDSSAQAFGLSSSGPAIGFLFRWKGHTDDPVFDPPITQPKSGFLPYGAIGWYHWRYANGQSDRWELIGNGVTVRGENSDPAQAIVFNAMYIFKMRVRTIPGQGGFYTFKVWKAGNTEPSAWMMSDQEGLTDPQSGSLLLMVHHVTATIGRVTVVPMGADVTPPVISNITVTPGARSAYITWATDEPANGAVAYGTTSSYGDTIKSSNSLVLTQGVAISKLTPSKTYHFKVIASDAYGNSGGSSDQAFSTTAAPVATTIVSDEFNTGSLNTSLWTFVNPTPPGGGSRGNTASEVTLSVNANVAHDLYTNGYQVPRIMQPANNTDFEVDIKFDSQVNKAYQLQGFVAEQDSNNLVRFDFSSDGSNTKVVAISFKGGFASPSIKIDAPIASAGVFPLYMRVKRETDVWTQSYSFDGLNWSVATIFYAPITLAKVGLFVGNAGTTPPAHTASFDYFRAKVVTAVPQEGPSVLPTAFALDQNYPNPFNPSTVIGFALLKESRVKLEVFNILGQHVSTLVDGTRPAGYYTERFNAAGLSSGIYFYRLTGDQVSFQKKMLILK